MKSLFFCILIALSAPAALAGRSATLTQFLRSTKANQLLIRIAPEDFSWRQIERMSLTEKEAALNRVLDSPSRRGMTLMEKLLDLSESGNSEMWMLISPIRERGSSIWEFMETTGKLKTIAADINASIRNGNEYAFRAAMSRLLDVPLAQIQRVGMENILSRKQFKMMYKHPNKAALHPFRWEYYDLIHVLAGKKIYFDIPAEHESIYYSNPIPELVFEETALGQAILADNFAGFVRAWKELVETATLGEMLAHHCARVETADSKSSLAMENMSKNNLSRLRDFYNSNELLGPSIDWLPMSNGPLFLQEHWKI